MLVKGDRSSQHAKKQEQGQSSNRLCLHILSAYVVSAASKTPLVWCGIPIGPVRGGAELRARR